MWLASVGGLQQQVWLEEEPQGRKAEPRPREGGSPPASSPALLPPSGQWGYPDARRDCPPPSAKTAFKCLTMTVYWRNCGCDYTGNRNACVCTLDGSPELINKNRIALIFTTLAVTLPERQLWMCESHYLSTQAIIIMYRDWCWSGWVQCCHPMVIIMLHSTDGKTIDNHTPTQIFFTTNVLQLNEDRSLKVMLNEEFFHPHHFSWEGATTGSIRGHHLNKGLERGVKPTETYNCCTKGYLCSCRWDIY